MNIKNMKYGNIRFVCESDDIFLVYSASTVWTWLGQTYHAQTLLAEVVVDVGGLHGQVTRGVEGVALILRRLIGGLAHG